MDSTIKDFEAAIAELETIVKKLEEENAKDAQAPRGPKPDNSYRGPNGKPYTPPTFGSGGSR